MKKMRFYLIFFLYSQNFLATHLHFVFIWMYIFNYKINVLGGRQFEKCGYNKQNN